MIISFAHTTAAMLAGEKTVSRRAWKPSHAAKFKMGMLVARLQEEFGEPPWYLDRAAISWLRGAAAVYYSADGSNPYRELLTALEHHGAISVRVR